MHTDEITTAPKPPVAATAPPPPRSAAARVWLRLVTHHLRMQRLATLAWGVGIALTGAGLAATYEDTYATPQAREQFAATVEGVPAVEALFGRTAGLDTLEGFVLWRWGGIAVLCMAVWGILGALSTRRGAEDAGRLELLRAGMVSPRGLALATMTALAIAHGLAGLLIGVTHQAAGMDTRTAWLFAAALALTASTFAALAALAGEVLPTARRAAAAAWSALGVAAALRVVAAGPETPEWVWWTTPLGWAGFLHRSDGAGHTVLAAYGGAIVLLSCGVLLSARRDLLAGRFSRAGDQPRWAPEIRSLRGLVARTTLPAALAYSGGIAAGFTLFGLLAEEFASVMADLPEITELLSRLGFVAIDSVQGVVGVALGLLVVVSALQGATAAAAVREEEASWRVEAILVRPVGRGRWLLTRVAGAGVAVLCASLAGGLGAWVGTNLGGTGLTVGEALALALALVPVGWLFLGIGVAVLGFLPRVTGPVTTGLVLGLYVLDLLGALLDLPEWALEVSPFRHVGAVPAQEVAIRPALAMVALAALGVALGLAGLRRRDLTEA